MIYLQHFYYNCRLRKVYHGVVNCDLPATFMLELYAKEGVARSC